MSAIKHMITDAEYEIMCILWRSKEKLTVADIIKERKEMVFTII